MISNVWEEFEYRVSGDRCRGSFWTFVTKLIENLTVIRLIYFTLILSSFLKTFDTQCIIRAKVHACCRQKTNILLLLLPYTIILCKYNVKRTQHYVVARCTRHMYKCLTVVYIISVYASRRDRTRHNIITTGDSQSSIGNNARIHTYIQYIYIIHMFIFFRTICSTRRSTIMNVCTHENKYIIRRVHAAAVTSPPPTSRPETTTS